MDTSISFFVALRNLIALRGTSSSFSVCSTCALHLTFVYKYGLTIKA